MTTYEEILLEIAEQIIDPITVIEQLRTITSFEELKNLLVQVN